MSSLEQGPVGAPRCFVVIPCAGSGRRSGRSGPKQYELLAGRRLVEHTVAAFLAVPGLAGVALVLAPDDDSTFGTDPRVRVFRVGGATRAASVHQGLQAWLAVGAQANDWVLVHDAARCLVTPAHIERLLRACAPDPVGGLLALPLPDTLKTAVSARVGQTLSRDDKWLAQTPQMFRLGALESALAVAAPTAYAGITDEASAMEAQGHAPLLVPGSAQNFKVTYPEDFALAEALLSARSAPARPLPARAQPPVLPWRMGEGWDVHALVPGRPLVLGGVTIPHDKGLWGHSDADALLHAITDAVLGAAGLGDIGTHFPDTSADFKDADSWQLLQRAVTEVAATGYRVANVDCTVIAQAPKLAPYKAAMRERIALALGVECSQVNVKAKTAEKMGPVGEGRSMEARAVALLVAV